MKASGVLAEMEAVGAILIDYHFVYTSGQHGPNYINMDPLFPHAALMFELCALLAAPFTGDFDTVAAPALGGVVLCELTALAATSETKHISAVWAEKDDNNFSFMRVGFVEHLRNKRVLLVEDLVTTGGSIAKVARTAVSHGAQVIGASVICNRGGVTASALGLPRLEALTSVAFTSYDPTECPLCEAPIPIITDVGHGATFQADNPCYAGGFSSLDL